MNMQLQGLQNEAAVLNFQLQAAEKASEGERNILDELQVVEAEMYAEMIRGV